MTKRKLKQSALIQILLVCFLVGSNSTKAQHLNEVKIHDYKSIIDKQGIGDNYDQKKKDFISKNPNDYKAMSGDISKTNQKFKTQIEKDEWVKNQKKITNNQINSTASNSKIPEFKSQEEKNAYFLKVNQKKEITTNNNDPTYPQFINTGDAKKDALEFEKNKNIFYKKLEEKLNRKPTQEEINEKNQSLKERGIIVGN